MPRASPRRLPYLYEAATLLIFQRSRRVACRNEIISSALIFPSRASPPFHHEQSPLSLSLENGYATIPPPPHPCQTRPLLPTTTAAEHRSRNEFLLRFLRHAIHFYHARSNFLIMASANRSSFVAHTPIPYPSSHNYFFAYCFSRY